MLYFKRGNVLFMNPERDPRRFFLCCNSFSSSQGGIPLYAYMHRKLAVPLAYKSKYLTNIPVYMQERADSVYRT